MVTGEWVPMLDHQSLITIHQIPILPHAHCAENAFVDKKFFRSTVKPTGAKRRYICGFGAA
jgi:hypothetical protein